LQRGQRKIVSVYQVNMRPITESRTET
jgi:hypothetical protein